MSPFFWRLVTFMMNTFWSFVAFMNIYCCQRLFRLVWLNVSFLVQEFVGHFIRFFLQKKRENDFLKSYEVFTKYTHYNCTFYSPSIYAIWCINENMHQEVIIKIFKKVFLNFGTSYAWTCPVLKFHCSLIFLIKNFTSVHKKILQNIL